jgi:hypothetical protein
MSYHRLPLPLGLTTPVVLDGDLDSQLPSDLDVLVA